MSPSGRARAHIFQDIAVILFSVAIAVILSQTDLIFTLLRERSLSAPLEAFIAGLFFTSAFTTAPAIVVLGKIAQQTDVYVVALCGAVGAVFGDYLIFRFIRDRVGQDLKAMLRTDTSRRLLHAFRSRLFRWMTPFIGALIIASPLPDEIAIAMLGLTKARTSVFIPFSFFANAIGIAIIGYIAQTL